MLALAPVAFGVISIVPARLADGERRVTLR